MGRSIRRNDATGSDAQMKLKREECAGGMVRRSNDAALKDAQIKQREEECAGGMGRRIWHRRHRNEESEGGREGEGKMKMKKETIR